MSNVLSEEQKQQILGLGRVGWSLRRIERETGIHRDTAARYLREAGVAVKKRGRPSKETAKPAISVAEVTPGSPSEKPVATPRPSGRIWSMITASAAATKVSNASCADMPAPSRPTPAPSSSLRPARKRRSITALARSSVIRSPANTGARVYSFLRSDLAANACACFASNPAPTPGPNSTKRPSAGSVAPRNNRKLAIWVIVRTR